MATPVLTLAPMPTLAPLPTLGPVTVPPAISDLMSSVAPTIPPGLAVAVSTLAPIVPTIAPGLSSTVADVVNTAMTNAARNATVAASGIGNTLKGVVGSGGSGLGGGISAATAGAHHPVGNADSVASVVTDSAADITKLPSGTRDAGSANRGPDQGECEGSAEVLVQKDDGIIPEVAKPFIIPIIGLIVGAAMMQVESVAMWGKLVLYFGAQSFMNIFMSWVLGTHVTIPAGTVLQNGSVLCKDLKGCPAGFLLTALQQLVSFILFMIYFLSVYPFPEYRYSPKPLNTMFEWISVVIFGMVFALNIALNNFSLGYISIGVNLIIRSCLPLTTYLSQQGLALVNLYKWKPFKWLEVTLMVVGVACAVLFTWAAFEGNFGGGGFIGILACGASLLCGSLNLALAGVLGETKLSVLDTCAYMAIPAAIFLAPIVFFIPKEVPGEWSKVSGESMMTDWEIFMVTWQYSMSTICWLFFSGVFSFMYNICQFTIVHTLSPSATAFGGNFNKAALTFMTLLCPFLQTKHNPPMPYIAWEWAALLCNICAFSWYSYLQIQAKLEAQAREHDKMAEQNDEETGSSSDSEE